MSVSMDCLPAIDSRCLLAPDHARARGCRGEIRKHCLAPMTSRKSSGVMASHVWGAKTAALATMMSRRPSSATPLSTASRSPSTSRVDDGGKDLLTGGLDELDGLGEVVGSRGIVGNARRKFARDVDGDDVGALVGHPDCVRATLTPCGPGDEGHLARQPSAHFWAALTRFDPMISRWISLVPSYNRSSRTSR
jgi:hypothetical protein